MPQSLIILRATGWRFNPLQSFLCDPSLFLVIIVDVLCRELQVSPRARLVLSEFVYGLFDRFGIWRGQRGHWPTLYDLVEELRKSTAVNAAAKEALLNRLITLLM